MVLTSDMDTEVSFLSGVTASGTIAAQSFATWQGDAPATYSTTSDQFKWQAAGTGALKAGTAGGTVTYAFNANSNFSIGDKALITAALTLWSDETGIKFALSSSQSSANAVFTRSSGTGSDESNARTTVKVGSSTFGSVVGQASITLGSQAILSGGTMAQDSYGIETTIHEIGHLIGLGHAGAYDEGAASNGELTALDTNQYSIMSYNQPAAGTNWGTTVLSSSTNAAGVTSTTSSANLPETPMMLDILAAQRLYGTSTSSTLAGGQVFGFNCNIADTSKIFFDFTQNIEPVVTLYDSGTGNTLDLSGFAAGSTINLAQGGFSNANGQTNNIGIALGTVITTAIGGAGNDFFFVGGADGTQHFDGEGGVNFIGTATAAGGGTVDVSMKDGTVTDGGTLDATFANVLGLQLAGGASDVLGLATGTGLVYGGTGTLTFTGEGAIDYIQASTGTNTILGGHGAEIVFSNGGIDNFHAGDGGSFLQAGQTASSQDTLTGSTGNDYVYGGAGTTTLMGGHGTEFLSGGSGTNTLDGGSGLNVFNGGAGTDIFHGGSGTNLLFEATGTDTFNGSTGTDYVYGGAGTSTMTGGSGTDVLTTGAGNQHFIGGTGLNVFNDVAAHLTAGRLDQIDNFGGNTNVYMPGASQGSTHFVAENGGTAILTSVGIGQAEIFVSGTGTAAVMAHTHFTL